MISLDLIVDKAENYDYLLKNVENHFKIDFYKLSDEYADAFNNEKKYIVCASPTKISFRISSDIDEVINDISSYLSKNYENKIVGIRCIGEELKLEKIAIKNVKTIIIR